MKKLLLVLVIGLIAMNGVFATPPFFEDFDYDNQAQLESVWNEAYSYSDADVNGVYVLNSDFGSDQVLQVGRTYIWSDEISDWFSVKIKTTTATSFSSADYNWTGSRLILANPDNILQRYEIRLYPDRDLLQVRYVDRSNRSGTFKWIDENTTSISIPITVVNSANGEQVESVNCPLDENKWYNLLVFRTGMGNKWKAIIQNNGGKNCIISWEENESLLKKPRYVVGLQSAGKDVVSYFDKVRLINPIHQSALIVTNHLSKIRGDIENLLEK